MRRIAAALGLCMLCWCLGCEEKVTESNYELIEVGMEQHQVESILGSGRREDVGGTGISSSGLLERSGDEGTRATYVWEEGGRQIIITFEDQKVRSKRKVGF